MNHYAESLLQSEVIVPAAAILLAGIVFWLLLFWALTRRPSAALKRRQRSRKMKIDASQARYLVVHDLSVAEERRMWRQEFLDKLPWRRFTRSEVLGHSRADTTLPRIGAETIRLIQQLADPWPHDALLLGGVFKVPQRTKLTEELFPNVRKRPRNRPRLPRDQLQEISKAGLDHPIVAGAVRRLRDIMQSAGYFPLVHSHVQGSADVAFEAQGIEAGSGYEKHPHKLFFQPATVMPHLPFSHSVSAEAADRQAGTVAPDVVAFIMIDNNHKRTALGPRLYWMDKLLDTLGKDTVYLLRQRDFQIIPDQSINDNKHGAINAIELFGHGADVRETQFMRFDYARIEPAAGTPRIGAARRAIWALRHVLDNKLGPFVLQTDMLAGDVLLVNNWRVAAAWDNEGAVNQWYDSTDHVHLGDRLVYQMHFYLQHERSPEGHSSGHH